MKRAVCCSIIAGLVITSTGSLTIAQKSGKTVTVKQGKCIDVVCLDDTKEAVLRRTRNRVFKTVRPPKGSSMQDLFKHVLQADVAVELLFNEMLVFQKVMVVLRENKVVAIIEKKPKSLVDGVDTAKGIEFFILNRGNKGLKMVQGESNSLYVYPWQGVAVIDDNNDDTIDLLVLFSVP